MSLSSSIAPSISETPAAPVVKVRAVERPGLRIIEAFTFAFESPKWFLNVLLSAIVAGFIPIVGQIVVTGYLFECLEDQLRAPRFGYLDFDLNQFVRYLKRGVFAWLVHFVMNLAGVGLAVMIYMPMVLAAVGMLNTRDEIWMVAGGFLLAFAYLVYIALLIIASVAPTPLILRVGLTEDVRQVTQWRWALSFMRKIYPELVLSVMVITVCMLPLFLFSFLICLIGPIVLTGIYYLIGLRMLQQLYELFLARGGEPIPLPNRAAAQGILPPGPEKDSPFMPSAG